MTLLGLPLDDLEDLAGLAARKGMLVFMSAGGIKEVRFPDYLSVDEEATCQEATCVI